MRRPAHLEPWLSAGELAAWMGEASGKAEYQRRLAVWLTHAGPLHAEVVARYLGVSKQAVWLWVGQYNRLGPGGLDREGRGGRRWAFLAPAREAELLAGFLGRATRGDVVTASHLHEDICRAAGREVSMAYVYRLLHRNGWRKLAPRPRHAKADPEAREAFKKNSRGPSGG